MNIYFINENSTIKTIFKISLNLIWSDKDFEKN